jgi:Zn-dependent protease with chaperone function
METKAFFWKLSWQIAGISALAMLVIYILGTVFSVPKNLTFSFIGWIAWLAYMEIGLIVIILCKYRRIVLFLTLTFLIGASLISTGIAAQSGRLPKFFFGWQSIIAGTYLIVCTIYGWLISRPIYEKTYDWHPRC